VPTAREIEQEFGRPFADVVRLHMLSRFSTRAQFADAIGASFENLLQLLDECSWELGPPPALELQNHWDGTGEVVRASGEQEAELEFVEERGLPAGPPTRGRVIWDEDAIHVTVRCAEPIMASIIAQADPAACADPVERAFREGDHVALRREHWRGDLGEMLDWARALPPPEHSVLLDDCVVICLTCVDAGRDRSHLTPIRHVRDPWSIIGDLRPREPNRVFLEGAWYFIAVNPLGAVLDAFYDPWETGTICPAWRSESQIEAEVLDDAWRIAARIPLRTLRPHLSEGTAWGIDLCRIRRAGRGRPVQTRGERTVIALHDRPVAEPRPPARRWTPMAPAVRLVPAERDFPSVYEWESAEQLGDFRDDATATPDRGVAACVAHDDRNLYVRFDCRESDLADLRVVTRREEEAEYGEGDRRVNYLDRREHFGLDWGDYVEVAVAPNLGASDRHHAGHLHVLVNSRGDLLERYYDTFGMCSVSAHPRWRSGARARVTLDEEQSTWITELAIPLRALCSGEGVSRLWGLNLHRHRAARDGRPAREIIWSPAFRTAPHPDWARQPPRRWLRDPTYFGLVALNREAVARVERPTPPPAALGRPPDDDGTIAERDRSSDRLQAVCFLDRDHGWAAGGLGTVLHTTDGGETWSVQASGTRYILEDICFIDHRRGWAVGGWPRDSEVALEGGMGVILATDDGGRTWTKQLDGEATWLSAVHFVDERHGWAVGEYGCVLHTTDGGATWRQMRRVPTPAWLHDVHFQDHSVAVAAGFNETVLLTTDGGRCWRPVRLPTPRRTHGWPVAWHAIAFANERLGWIVGDWGNVLRTEDGGGSWTLDRVALPDELLDLACLRDVAVDADGSAWAVSPLVTLRCPPGSRRWEPVRTQRSCRPHAVAFAQGRGWMAGERGAIIATDGHGAWHTRRETGARMGLLYASPHGHHINGSPLAALGEEFDAAYVLISGGRKDHQAAGDYQARETEAAAMTLGVPVVHTFREFIFSERDLPHKIAERYQQCGGLEPLVRRLVALIRALRPEVLVAEGPIAQEGYYAHGVGETARATIEAFDAAGDPGRFTELSTLGLQPWEPRKLYLLSLWVNELYGIHPPTLHLAPQDRYSPRIGMTYSEAITRSRHCFWGLLDRHAPPAVHQGWAGAWKLHLKRSRVHPAEPEQDIYDGIRRSPNRPT